SPTGPAKRTRIYSAPKARTWQLNRPAERGSSHKRAPQSDETWGLDGPELLTTLEEMRCLAARLPRGNARRETLIGTAAAMEEVDNGLRTCRSDAEREADIKAASPRLRNLGLDF